jgi:hypothetical protein
MEEQTQTLIEHISPKATKTRPLLMTLLAVVIIFAAAGGVYLWQHNKVTGLNSEVQNLHSQLSAKATPARPTLTNKTFESLATFTYAPKTGGLSLTLPKSYGIIVNVDGNKGGAPGATFRVASSANNNVFADAVYQGVQVDADNTFTNLSQSVQAKESQLNEQSTATRTYRVTDATVAGLPAKLIKTDGLDEYQGNVTIYLVGSGSFLYIITANGNQNSSFPMLDAVLKGLTIKPVTL